MIMKTLRYFYRPDHLGSTLWVTDSAKNGVQYCEYLPYGKPFIDQRSTTWSSRYTFSGKERDSETGYSYFGARYYHSDLSIWLSVDPLSDKYPNLTPYAYCANNPVILVDPDGRTIILTGSDSRAALEQLNAQTSFLFGLKLGADGKTLKATGIALTKKDRALKKMIKDKAITVELICQSDNEFETEHGIINSQAGGIYGGSKFDEEFGVWAKQYVSPSMLADFDARFQDDSFGETMLHEVAEAYAGGELALSNYCSYEGFGQYNSSYNYAHSEANKIALGTSCEIIVRDFGGYELIENRKIGPYTVPHLIFNPDKITIRHGGYKRCNQ